MLLGSTSYRWYVKGIGRRTSTSSLTGGLNGTPVVAAGFELWTALAGNILMDRTTPAGFRANLVPMTVMAIPTKLMAKGTR